MATLPKAMSDAVPQQVASAEANNNIIRNVTYLASELTDTQSLVSNHTGRLDADHGRITTLENRTTNATTGNTQLGTRVATLETRTSDTSTGNAALGTRVSTLESSSGGGTGGGVVGGGRWYTKVNYGVPANGKLGFEVVSGTPVGITNVNNNDFRIGATGVYNIQVNAHLSGTSGNNYWLWISYSTSTDPRWCIEVLPMAVNGNIVINCSALYVPFKSGDTVSAYLWSSAGTTQVTNAERQATNIAFQRVA